MTFGRFRKLLDRSKPADSSSQIAKEFLAALELISQDKSAKLIGDSCERINEIWIYLFDLERVLAPQKKYELAEELVIRPDIVKYLILTFRYVTYEFQKKIRDLIYFIQTWCSNDSIESSVPRRKAKKPKNIIKVRDALYHSKETVIELITTGYDEPSSIGVFNDIIQVFVEDDKCLEYILKDKKRSGCFWFIFDRLSGSKTPEHSTQDQFDLIVGALETLEMFMKANNRMMNTFLNDNWDKFATEINKLMTSSMFIIKLKSMKIFHTVVTSRNYASLRDRWVKNPENIRIVMNNMLNPKKEVRFAAVELFELYLHNPNNHVKVQDFLVANCDRLISHLANTAPVHMYQGTLEELEDARYADIIHLLFQLKYIHPLSIYDHAEQEKEVNYQAKLKQEQSIETRPAWQDTFSGPIVGHTYNLRIPYRLPVIRENTICKINDQVY